MKHYRRKGAQELGSPSLLFEVWFDLQDPRSGFRGSSGTFFKADLADSLGFSPDFAQENVVELDSGQFVEMAAPREIPWPLGSEERLLEHLAQYHRIRIWGNPALGLFSKRGEAAEEFVERCREALCDERNARLRRLREIFLPRFLEFESKRLKSVENEDEDEESKEARSVQIRSYFAAVHENLSRWTILREGVQPPPHSAEASGPPPLDGWENSIDPDLRDHVEQLRGEFFSQYNRTLGKFESKASRIEAYEVVPTFPQIEVVSRGIIWG